jgi:hypothetical protein
MNTTTKFGSAALAALVLSTVVAQAASFQMQQLDSSRLQLAKIAGCTVAGTPVEFPDDIWIINKGLGKLVAGTKVQWSIPGYSSYKGTHTLVADLTPGQGVKLSGVLGGGVEAGHDCAAKAL